MELHVEQARLLIARPLLTLVAPTRNEAENVAALVRRLSDALDGITYELLFVDDSDDETPEAIREEKQRDRRVRLLHREPDQRVRRPGDGGGHWAYIRPTASSSACSTATCNTRRSWCRRC